MRTSFAALHDFLIGTDGLNCDEVPIRASSCCPFAPPFAAAPTPITSSYSLPPIRSFVNLLPSLPSTHPSIAISFPSLQFGDCKIDYGKKFHQDTMDCTPGYRLCLVYQYALYPHEIDSALRPIENLAARTGLPACWRAYSTWPRAHAYTHAHAQPRARFAALRRRYSQLWGVAGRV